MTDRAGEDAYGIQLGLSLPIGGMIQIMVRPYGLFSIKKVAKFERKRYEET
ncbi:MAG: hypothetical protein HQK75_16145 [Candidatus Magnetomorum sp.]|nr:hypothetical protein [Candidatus Magnetomorum sp.]